MCFPSTAMGTIVELQKQLRRKDEELRSKDEKIRLLTLDVESKQSLISELVSQLDKYKSVFNQSNTFSPGPRKRARGFGISAEPQAIKSPSDAKEYQEKKYPKDEK